MILSPIQVKGVISTLNPDMVGDSLEETKQTFIFLDLFYLAIDLDMVEIE